MLTERKNSGLRLVKQSAYNLVYLLVLRANFKYQFNLDQPSQTLQAPYSDEENRFVLLILAYRMTKKIKVERVWKRQKKIK